jgi:hypothetical protein
MALPVLLYGRGTWTIKCYKVMALPVLLYGRETWTIKCYKVMALPVLLYGREAWTIKAKDMSKIQATEMRYLRSVKGCTKLDHIKNEDIRKELDIDSTKKKNRKVQKKLIEHLDRMPDERIPKKILKYKPKGCRDQGRP